MGKTENSSGIIGRLRPANTPAPRARSFQAAADGAPIDIHELSHHGSVPLFPKELIGALPATKPEERGLADQRFIEQCTLPRLRIRGSGHLVSAEVDDWTTLVRPDSPEQPLQYLVAESYQPLNGPAGVLGSGLSYWAYDSDSEKWLLLDRWNAHGKASQMFVIGPVFEDNAELNEQRKFLTRVISTTPIVPVSEEDLKSAGIKRLSS